MKRLLILAALLGAPGLAQAQNGPSLHARTAGELADLCSRTGKDPADAARFNWCSGFAQGVVDTELGHAGEKKPFCFPSPAPSRSSTLREFVQWVRANASEMGKPPQDAFLRFMGQRFPCRS
jgi:hypothetical protein